MTKTPTAIMQLLESRDISVQAKRTAKLIRERNMQPVAEAPSSVTVAEALRLWRTRQANIPSTKQPIEGLSELIQTLEHLTPQKKLDQYGFTGLHSAAAIFFTRADGHFVGATIALQK